MHATRTLLYLAAVSVLFSNRTFAADVFWLNAVDGNWSDGTNWSTGSPPDHTDHAFIMEPGKYVISLTGNAIVNSMTIQDAEIDLATNQLQIHGGSLNYEGGSITGPGTLLLGDGAQMNASAGYTNASGVTLKSGAACVINAAILNEGIVTRTTNLPGDTIFNGAFTNGPTGLLLLAGPGITYRFNAGLENFGTLTLAATGFVNVFVDGGPLVNHDQGLINGSGTQSKTLTAELINMPGGRIEVPIELYSSKGRRGTCERRYHHCASRRKSDRGNRGRQLFHKWSAQHDYLDGYHPVRQWRNILPSWRMANSTGCERDREWSGSCKLRPRHPDVAGRSYSHSGSGRVLHAIFQPHVAGGRHFSLHRRSDRLPEWRWIVQSLRSV